MVCCSNLKSRVILLCHDTSHCPHFLLLPTSQYNPMLPALTRRRESFLGRLAMLGISAACFWEVWAGSVFACVDASVSITDQLSLLLNSSICCTKTLILCLILASHTVVLPGPPLHHGSSQRIHRHPSPAGRPVHADWHCFHRPGRHAVARQPHIR